MKIRNRNIGSHESLINDQNMQIRNNSWKNSSTPACVGRAWKRWACHSSEHGGVLSEHPSSDGHTVWFGVSYLEGCMYLLQYERKITRIPWFDVHSGFPFVKKTKSKWNRVSWTFVPTFVMAIVLGDWCDHVSYHWRPVQPVLPHHISNAEAEPTHA